MEPILIIFLILAILNIVLSIAKWILTGRNEFSGIMGWVCAILFCITASNCN
jgi:hypothetical protein